VELDDDVKYAMKGEETFAFHVESSCSFNAQYVLNVHKLKNNFLSISVLEEKGFHFISKKGKLLIHPFGSIPHIVMRIVVRE